MPQVQLNDRVVKILSQIMASQKNRLKESLEQTKQLEVGTILNQEIMSVRSHKGYGGTTYVVQARLHTTFAEVVNGGIVIKFANKIDEETGNAMQLHELLKVRQQEWDAMPQDRLPPLIKSFPPNLFAPAVLETVIIPNSDIHCLILEFVENGIPLIDSQERGGFSEKLQVLGYSLARLHGTRSMMTEMAMYDPLMNHMRGYASDRSLAHWADILRQSMGSVDLIHGDSHLQNILRSNPGTLAWIDAMLVEHSDRMDDVGYALSYLIQKYSRQLVMDGYSSEEVVKYLVDVVTQNWVPEVMNGYMATIDISRLYHYLTLDFFLGSHCIVRSGLWNDPQMKGIMKEVGRHFIEQWPVNRFYGRI